MDGEFGSYLSLSPHAANQFLTVVKDAVDQASMQVVQPLLITGTRVRPFVKQATEGILPHLVVLSQNEVPPNIPLESVGSVTLA